MTRWEAYRPSIKGEGLRQGQIGQEFTDEEKGSLPPLPLLFIEFCPADAFVWTMLQPQISPSRPVFSLRFHFPNSDVSLKRLELPSQYRKTEGTP